MLVSNLYKYNKKYSIISILDVVYISVMSSRSFYVVMISNQEFIWKLL